MAGWFSKALKARQLDPAQLREALGRLGFVYGAFQYDRPFLAPLFEFLSLHRPGREVRLPLYVLIVLRWLRDRIRARRSHPLRRRAYLGKSLLRLDAKAEGLSVAVGGWAPNHDD